MPGETMHQIGADGMRRAKKWLDSTTRVLASWTNEDAVVANRLEFQWPHGGQNFSFDLGGLLCGGDFEMQSFVAECKKYSAASDQGEHYDDWLAKCYIMRRDYYRNADHFMWITWHPFRVGVWNQLLMPDSVKRGLLTSYNRKRIFDTDEEEKARALIDEELVNDVAGRLWLIVLSDKQEKLVIGTDDLAELVARRIRQGASS
jgi:hypothetical protein